MHFYSSHIHFIFKMRSRLLQLYVAVVILDAALFLKEVA